MSRSKRKLFFALDWLLTILFIGVCGGAGLYGIYNYLSSQGKPSAVRQAVEVAPPDKALLLFHRVGKVSGELSTLMLSPYFALAMNKSVPCMMAKSMNEGSDRNDPVVVTLAARYTGECSFTRFSSHLTVPVFEKIAETQLLPATLVTFEVFRGNSWIVVGAFDSNDTCNSAREEATSHGMGTKSCGVWQARY